MPRAMRHACTEQCTEQCGKESTLLTLLTHSRNQDNQRESSPFVTRMENPVDNSDSAKWIIRKRFSFMYGSPGMYWRVLHPSLPEYFGHSYHLYSFEDALGYVLDHIDGREVAS